MIRVSRENQYNITMKTTNDYLIILDFYFRLYDTKLNLVGDSKKMWGSMDLIK